MSDIREEIIKSLKKEIELQEKFIANLKEVIKHQNNLIILQQKPTIRTNANS